MTATFVKLIKNELMELHLDILKDLLNGVDFKDIEQKYSARFEDLNYLENRLVT